MAPKTKSEVEGVLTKVARMFNAGELAISVDSALKQVPLCAKYTKSGGCPMRCKNIHVNKQGKLCPSVGLLIAWELERDPASHPGVRVDPLLALQAFLLANHSSLVVDHVYERENALVFLFAEQHISSVVKQIARQRWVRIDVGGHIKTLHASEQIAPTLTLHGVKQESLQSSLNILVNGFNYGTHAQPFGIYSVEANTEQSGRIKYYDGGAAIVLKPTGFVANVTGNSNRWLTGAPPGVMLFNRTAAKLREFILHRESVQIAYLSMEQSLFEPWAREYAVHHPDKIRAAHHGRRDWRSRAGVVLSSVDDSSMKCEIAQIMAGPPGVSRPLLTVAQPRSRSRSPSELRFAGSGGVCVPPPPGFYVDEVRLGRAGLLLPEPKDFDMERLWSQTQSQFTFKGGGSTVSVPDHRSFVPSSVGRMSCEYGEMDLEGAQCSTGSSLGAARSVVQEFHVADRTQSSAESDLAVTAASVTASSSGMKQVLHKVAADHEWPCDGPGCFTIMRSKREWQKYYHKYYCERCYDSIVTASSTKENQSKIKGVQERSCDGPECAMVMRGKDAWVKYYNKYYCKRCYHSDNVLPLSR